MIYFNNNATSYPKPDCVISAVRNNLAEIPVNTYRSGFKARSVVDMCRGKVADLFNVDNLNNIIFTSGSTEALNLAIFGLENPKHIITTDIEHNSVLRPLKILERDIGLAITIVGCDDEGFINPAEIEENIIDQTSAIIVNHCSNVTGTIQDIDTISKIARKHQVPFILDAAQSAGAVDIDLQKTPVDLLAFTGHKSLFASTGIGGLVINSDIYLKPLKVGGTGIRSDYLYQPETMPVYYEAGTHNTVGLAALAAGIDYISEKGIESIHKAKSEIFHIVMNGLKHIPGIIFYGGTGLRNKLPVINFGLKGISIADIAFILGESFDINLRAGLHCAPLIHNSLNSLPQGTVRLSFSHFNTPTEALYLVEAVSKIANSVETEIISDHYENN